MNTSIKDHSQFELFPLESQNTGQKPKNPLIIKDLTLSQENIIVLCIVFMLSMVLTYSFGIEKGSNFQRFASYQNNGSPSAENIATPQVLPDEQKQAQQTADGTAVPSQEIADTRAGHDPSLQPDQPVERIKIEEDYYTIQVASFEQKKSAQKEAERLSDIGYEILIVPKGKHSIVCVGKFAKREEAKDFSSKLKSRYNDCLIRRL